MQFTSTQKRAAAWTAIAGLVLLALRALTLGQREAAVLTFYLDLTEVQAAAAMQVSQAALGRHLTAARAALRAALPAEP